MRPKRKKFPTNFRTTTKIEQAVKKIKERKKINILVSNKKNFFSHKKTQH